MATAIFNPTPVTKTTTSTNTSTPVASTSIPTDVLATIALKPVTYNSGLPLATGTPPIPIDGVTNSASINNQVLMQLVRANLLLDPVLISSLSLKKYVLKKLLYCERLYTTELIDILPDTFKQLTKSPYQELFTIGIPANINNITDFLIGNELFVYEGAGYTLDFSLGNELTANSGNVTNGINLAFAIGNNMSVTSAAIKATTTTGFQYGAGILNTNVVGTPVITNFVLS